MRHRENAANGRLNQRHAARCRRYPIGVIAEQLFRFPAPRHSTQEETAMSDFVPKAMQQDSGYQQPTTTGRRGFSRKATSDRSASVQPSDTPLVDDDQLLLLSAMLGHNLPNYLGNLLERCARKIERLETLTSKAQLYVVLQMIADDANKGCMPLLENLALSRARSLFVTGFQDDDFMKIIECYIGSRAILVNAVDRDLASIQDDFWIES